MIQTVSYVDFNFPVGYNLFMTSRADEMKRVMDHISTWLTRINTHNSLDYFDINKDAEDLATRLLNQLLDSELENLNLTKKRNFPGIDLAKADGFAVQVTSQRTAAKIRESLEKFKTNFGDR